MIAAVFLHSENLEAQQDSLDEMEQLVDTLGCDIAGHLVQPRIAYDSRSYFGKGKIAELATLVASTKATIVAVDGNLSPAQTKNLEKALNAQIMDRTEVILQIFADHARTPLAKTQVEIAQLKFLMTRLTGRWLHLGRQVGGMKLKGVGEKQIELDRRMIKDRISFLTKSLESMDKACKEKRKRRHDAPKVALVGYTNAGKSSLLKSLTGNEAFIMDKLFATLDSSVKIMEHEQRPRVLVTDTVGFIKKLPHSLVLSFRSTLDEVRDADLLLHVVDASHRHYEEHIKETEAVLREIDSFDKPTIYVFNKADKLDDIIKGHLLRRAYPDCLLTSCLSGDGVDALKDRIYAHFADVFSEQEIDLPYEKLALLSTIRQRSQLIREEYFDNKVRVQVRGSKQDLAFYQKQLRIPAS